jgi:hypothetical protein
VEHTVDWTEKGEKYTMIKEQGVGRKKDKKNESQPGILREYLKIL